MKTLLAMLAALAALWGRPQQKLAIARGRRIDGWEVRVHAGPLSTQVEVFGLDQRLTSRGGAVNFHDPVAVALMCPEARGWLERQAAVVDVGRLVFRMAKEPTDDDLRASALLVARMLAPLDDVVGRLHERMQDEPFSGVRVAIVRALYKRGADVTRYAGHVDPAVRLFVADIDGDEEALILLCADPDQRLLAIRALEGWGMVYGLGRVAIGAYQDADFALLRDVLSAGHRLEAETLAELCREVLRSGVGLAQVGDVACALLGAVGRPEDTSLLSRLVGASALPETQRAAVEALGHIGTVEAVPRLKALVDAGGPFPGVLAHSAARSAAAIQARVGDAARGGLSVATPRDDTGALSVSEAQPPSGQLSMPDAD